MDDLKRSTTNDGILDLRDTQGRPFRISIATLKAEIAASDDTGDDAIYQLLSRLSNSSGDASSTTKYPSVKAMYDLADTKEPLSAEVDGSTSATLSAFNVRNKVIDNVGQGNSNVDLALPVPAAGYNFKLHVGEPSDNYLKITAPVAGTMIVDGVVAKDFALFATPAIGNYMEVFTAKVLTNPTGLFVIPSLNIGSLDATKVMNATFKYRIAGVKYDKATAETALGNTVIPINTFGAVALDIEANGTITVVEASANATGYGSAMLAVAGIPACADTKVRMGTITVTGSAADFTLGTTALNAADTVVAYNTGAIDIANSYAWIVKAGSGTITTTIPS